MNIDEIGNTPEPSDLKPIIHLPYVQANEPYPWENSYNPAGPVRNVYDDMGLGALVGKFYDVENPVYVTIGESSFDEDDSVSYSELFYDTDEDAEDGEDISDEEYRHYIFGKDKSVMILHPQVVYEFGESCVIVDRDAVFYQIPRGWICMEVEML